VSDSFAEFHSVYLPASGTYGVVERDTGRLLYFGFSSDSSAGVNASWLLNHRDSIPPEGTPTIDVNIMDFGRKREP